jgi:hypothetical protein
MNTTDGSNPVSPAARRGRYLTVIQAALLLVAVLLSAAVGLVLMRPPTVRAQGPGGFGGFPGGQERQLVAQFDANKNRRLEADERKEALAWIEAQGASGGFRGGRRGGRGFAMAPGSPGRSVSPGDVRAYGNEPLYDTSVLRTIFIRFDNSDWERELAAFHNTDVEVPATVIVDGREYRDVGVHFRGASSFMMVPAGLKRSLNLSFDFVHERQQIGGYRSLNLLNANGDPTYVRGVLYAEIASAYIPTPRANYVRVVINGESWGPYVNVQQFNRDFVREFFKDEKGARWKVPGRPGGRGGLEYLGEDVEAYKRLFEIKTKDDPKAWSDLIALCRVLNQTPAETLEAALAPILDIDGTLRFLALEAALVNSDGYWTRASDYNIYQDTKGRFHVIPHDVNEALMTEGGRGGRGPGPGGPPPMGPDGPPPGGAPGGFPAPPPFGPGGGRGFGRGGSPTLDPLVGLDDTTKPLRSKLLAVPALRAKYLAYVRDIAAHHLEWSRLQPRVRTYQALIADDVKADTRKLYSYEEFQSGVGALQTFVEERRAFLLK